MLVVAARLWSRFNVIVVVLQQICAQACCSCCCCVAVAVVAAVVVAAVVAVAAVSYLTVCNLPFTLSAQSGDLPFVVDADQFVSRLSCRVPSD